MNTRGWLGMPPKEEGWYWLRSTAWMRGDEIAVKVCRHSCGELFVIGERVQPMSPRFYLGYEWQPILPATY